MQRFTFLNSLVFGMVIGLLAPAVAPAAPDGARLYEQHCAACHGSEGTGGVGVPLALPDFQYSVSDRFLRQSIRHGRPGRVMPAFSEFSEADVEALVRQIRSWAPGKPLAYPSERISANPQHGKQLYAQHCAACHGAQGEGGRGTGVTFSRPRDLPIISPALNNSGFLAAASDQLIKAALMNGREGTPMPSFLKLGLSEQDIDDLVSYVRSFENLPDPNHIPSPDDEPLSIIYDSPYSMDETIDALQRAAVGRNFRVIRVQTLDNGLVDPEHENHQQQIVYFCNFQMLNDALAIDPRVGLFLPCRVTVVQRDDKVQVISLNPKRLSYLFNNAELNKMCDEMANIYREIIEEATL